MADTGAPLNITLMEIGQDGKEPLFNAAVQTINDNMGSTALTTTFILSGDISPPQIVANTDNYAPTGLATAAVLRLTTDASRNLTGITGGADGRVLFLLNVGSNPLVLVDDATSTAGNRFQLSGNVTLGADEGALIWYDSTSSRWRLVARYTPADASTNTSTSVDSEIVLFSGTGGKTLKRATQTGLLTGTSGVIGAVTAPSGAVVGTTDTQTLTNKRVTRRVVSITDATSLTPNADTTDIGSQVNTQTAGTLTFNAPTGTPTDGQPLQLRIKTTNAQTPSFNAIYRGGTDLALPVTLAAGKTHYLGFQYNSTDTKWDLLALTGGI